METKTIKLTPDMKTVFIAFFLFFNALAVHAQDCSLYWKYKDYEGVAFSVPWFAVDIASWFLDEETDRVLLRKINKVRVLAFENGNPVSERDIQRFDSKAKRRQLEELMYVRQGKRHIRVMAKENDDAIRKIVVLVQSPSEFALISVQGRFHWDDISKVIGKYGKDAKKKGKPLVKIPVSRA